MIVSGSRTRYCNSIRKYIAIFRVRLAKGANGSWERTDFTEIREDRAKLILKAQISRISQIFASDYRISLFVLSRAQYFDVLLGCFLKFLKRYYFVLNLKTKKKPDLKSGLMF